MAKQSNSFRETRYLVIAASLVIIIYGINQAQSVVALFLVDVSLALIGTQPVLKVEVLDAGARAIIQKRYAPSEVLKKTREELAAPLGLNEAYSNDFTNDATTK